MIDRHLLARAYLAPPPGSFWRWSADGEAVEWANGKTIAFQKEVAFVLARLAPHGLPPFPAVVLLLAACRDGWGESAEELGLMLGFQRWLEQQKFPVPDKWVTHIFAGLDRVHALPAELRSTVGAESVLAELVFEASRHVWTAESSAQILQAIADGITPDSLEPDSSKNDRDDLPYVVFSLGDGLARVEAETLRLRARTGLDQLVEPAEVELPPVERVRQLICELKSDAELSGLAALARDLMAVVHLPRAISTPDELPVGGVSDIANRGPLDRLLVSELAHDDLTLAVRVALNEALYLRRESPPRTPPTRRVLLIDSGIRLWGVPRVFATAVALALAATGDKKLEVEAYRANGGSLDPVDLTTRAGLVSHLEALEPSPHPGAALQPFCRLAATRDEACDLVLVTHEDVLADADFRAALTPIAERSLFAATVSHDGSFRLLSISAAGQKVVRAADLSLDKLVPRPSRQLPGTPLVNPAHDSSLPVILSLNPFPLLLPHPVNRRAVRVSERHGAVAVTRDGRLMHWHKPGLGARQLTALLPPGTLHWFSVDGALARLEFEEPTIHRAVLFTADLESGECRAFPFETDGFGPLAVCAHGGALFRVFRGKVDVIDLETGRRHEQFKLPPNVHWKHDRFFTSCGDWLALGFDGTSARLDHVRVEAAGVNHAVLMLFNRAGCDGPWGVTASGHVISTADGPLATFFRHHLGVPVEPIEVSPDGHRVAIRSARSADVTRTQSREAVLDLKSGQVEHGHNARGAVLDQYIGQSVKSRGLRTRFRGITLVDQSRLALVSNRGEWLAIALDASRKRLSLLPTSLRTTLADSQWSYVGVDPDATVVERSEPVQTFRPVARPPGTRFDLKLASWRDGSRAYLDSRGMLHLVSSDRSLPEITIVLAADGELAAWCSNGVLTGPKYFTGEQAAAPPGVVYQLIQSFVLNLR